MALTICRLMAAQYWDARCWPSQNAKQSSCLIRLLPNFFHATSTRQLAHPITSLVLSGRLTLSNRLRQIECEKNEMVAAARELPASGYALEVDGRLKAEFSTRDGARAGAVELKKRFPMLRVRIYDAQTRTREEI